MNFAVYQVIEFENRLSLTEVLSSDSYGLDIYYQFERLNYFTVSTELGVFTEVFIDKLAHTSFIGEPKLPVSRRFIAVPIGAQVQVRAVNFKVTDYQFSDYGMEYPIIPAQHPVSKSPDVEPKPFELNVSAYERVTFSDRQQVRVEEVGIMRVVRLFVIEVYPLDYNPQENTLRIYNDIEVEVRFIGSDYLATEELRERTYSHYFEFLYEEQILNYEQVENRQNLTRYPIKYIIISDPMFSDALQPFIDWKIKKGFEMIVGYTGTPEVGNTTTSIKNFIQSIWNSATPGDPAPSFVLFVGDTAQIPAYSGSDTVGSHVSDLHYARLEGTDYLPEMFYGRFSTNNITELQPQVDKTLVYEQLLIPDTSYLGQSVLIAGVDSGYGTSHGNGHINYATEHYFNASNGISPYVYLYPASGSSSAAIINNVSNGVGYANNTAHGSTTSWSNPSFTISNIYNLQNENKYPFVVGNCCITNTFSIYECFGEAWLRAPNKGAIGYIGGTNNTYWNEDFWWGVGYVASIPSTGNALPYETTGPGMFDRLFHTHGESFVNWYTTGGAMIYAGNMAVQQSTSSLKNYYWEIYALMGDPSLTPYMRVPLENIASFPQQIFLGQSELQISAQPYSYVGLSMNGDLFGVGLVDASGQLNMEITPFTTVGTAFLVISLQNHQPIIADIQVIPLDGPYVVLNAWEINVVGNPSNIPQYGDTINLHVSLENIGIQVATDVSAQLSTEDTFLTIVDDAAYFGSIAAESTVTIQNAFQVTIADNIPDQHRVQFTLQITDNENIWTSNFNFYINAPALEVTNFHVQDPAPGGNNNGRLDPGEIVTLNLVIENAGHAASQSGTASLTVNNPPITISDPVFNLSPINPSATINSLYTVAIDESINPGTVVEFTQTIDYGAYTTVYLRSLPVGLVLEDFETGNFTSFPWTFSGNANWTIDTSTVYEGVYSAKSGLITHSQNTSLQVTLSIASNSEISFYRKVSSESNYDFLRFFIDDVQQAQWSGEVDWSQVSYPVNAGERTFRWTYIKDGSVSTGSDCAWVDYIVFPELLPQDSPRNLIASAGNGFVNLSWSPPVDGVPLSYNIYRDGVLLNNTNLLNYTDNSVTNGTTYSYYVTALFTTYESAPSNTVQATPDAIQSVTIGYGTTLANYLPLNMYWRNSLTQTIYFASEIGIIGSLTHITYYNNFATNLSNKPVKIWVGETTASYLSGGWIPSTSLNLVFDGLVNFPSGANTIEIPLQSPYNYNGQNLVIMVNRPMDSQYFSSNDRFNITATGVSNRTRYLYSDSVTYDPANPSGGTLTDQIANTTLQFIMEEPPTLDIPQILEVNILDGTLYISWEIIEGATEYVIETSEDLSGDFIQPVQPGIFSQEGNIITWECPVAEPIRFYRVKAIAPTPAYDRGILERYVE